MLQSPRGGRKLLGAAQLIAAPGASMDELRAEMRRHLEILAPVLDLEALVAPSDGTANREVQEG